MQDEKKQWAKNNKRFSVCVIKNSSKKKKKDSTIEMENNEKLFFLPTRPKLSFPSAVQILFQMFAQRFCDLLQPAPLTISKGIIPRHYCIFIIPTRSSFFFCCSRWKVFFSRPAIFSLFQQKSEPLIFGLIWWFFFMCLLIETREKILEERIKREKLFCFD